MEKVNLTIMNEDVRNIQKLDSHPTPGTMHAGDLQQLFDKAGVDIKTFINDTLIPELTEYLKSAVDTTDPRLTNARKCNDEFNDKSFSRYNLGIRSGSSLPSDGNDGDIFFKY